MQESFFSQHTQGRSFISDFFYVRYTIHNPSYHAKHPPHAIANALPGKKKRGIKM